MKRTYQVILIACVLWLGAGCSRRPEPAVAPADPVLSNPNEEASGPPDLRPLSERHPPKK